MGFGRRLLLVAAAAVTPPAIYVHSEIRRLEREYPRLEPSASSTSSLRTSADPASFFTPHVDVYSAKVPAEVLASRQLQDGRELSPEEAWARVFLQSPILQLEGKMSGGYTRGAGDLGEGGFREGQTLLNGMFEVVRAPSQPTSVSRGLAAEPPVPLLVRWEFPPPGVALYRKAATEWGLPYRMMSGGRHEFSLGGVDAKGMLEVRFASAHDYEWISDEGDSQKVQPRWVGRLHRAFAMWLLDERVKALKMDVGDTVRR